MDRTEVNASPVQKALQGIKKYKYVLLTALLGVLLLLLPQDEKAAATASATPSAAENFDREAVEALKETLNAEQDSALSDSIAAQTQAYIEDKASSLGLSVRAEVQTALRDGVPFPDSVTLYGENSAALGAYIVQELGIAEENQLWIEPK